MKCFHLTEYKYLEKIMEEGLKPNVGVRSISADYFNSRLYFAVGYTALVSIYYMMKFKFISKLTNEYKSFDEYIGDGPVLSFDLDKIDENMKLYDASVDYSISPENISFVYLIDSNGNIITQKSEIIYYLMGIVKPNDIRNLVFDYLDDQKLKDSKIFNLILSEYDNNKDKIELLKNNYNLKLVKLDEVNISEILNLNYR